MSLALERTLAALEHPRFVTPLGDRREKAVPCALCKRPTLAIRGPVCLACEPDEKRCPCGEDMGDDPHDADELGSEQVCPDCCKQPGCKSSETTRPVSDLDGGAFPPTTGSAASAGTRVCGQTAAAPAIDSRSTNQGEKQ